MRDPIAKLPLVLSLALLAACLVGSLVVFEPWLKDSAAKAIDYRVCNVVVPKSPDDPEVFVSARPAYKPALSSLVVGVKRDFMMSLLWVDPKSGELEREDIRTAGDRQLLYEILESIRVEYKVPEFWPYTEQKQLPVEFTDTEYFRYRQPDPGAGLLTLISGSHGGGIGLTLKNCRSSLSLFQRGRNAPLEAVRDEVHPLDRAAFQTFVTEIQPK